MGEVVTGVAFGQNVAHMTGEAFCAHCQHFWTAVAPLGTKALECPECGTMKGLFRNIVAPKDGHFFECKCGNDLYMVQPHRILCCGCGTETSWEALADECKNL